MGTNAKARPFFLFQKGCTAFPSSPGTGVADEALPPSTLSEERNNLFHHRFFAIFTVKKQRIVGATGYGPTVEPGVMVGYAPQIDARNLMAVPVINFKE